MGVGPGDEVLTSTFTFAATANAITYVGAKPVFIDSDRATWNMDPDLLAEELRACAAKPKASQGRRGGRPVRPMRRLRANPDGVRRDYDVPLVEDAAEALGATYDGRPAGSFGVIGTFSFNGNKIITSGGGGMLTCRRKDWARRARQLATQSRDPAPALPAFAHRLQLST